MSARQEVTSCVAQGLQREYSVGKIVPMIQTNRYMVKSAVKHSYLIIIQ